MRPFSAQQNVERTYRPPPHYRHLMERRERLGRRVAVGLTPEVELTLLEGHEAGGWEEPRPGGKQTILM